jgi:hypothetical protein
VTTSWLRRGVASEAAKVFSTRLWWGLGLGAVGSSALGALLQALLAGVTIPGSPAVMPPVSDPSTVRLIYTSGLSTTYVMTMCLGIIAITGEYRHQTMTATALATPRRGRIVLAKLLTLPVIGFGYGLAAAVTGVLVGAPLIAVRGGSIRLLTDGVPRALGLSVLGVVLWTGIGLGIGTMITSQVPALIVALGFSTLVEPLVAFGLNLAHLGDVARFLPTQATNALISPATSEAGYTVAALPWWGGALTLLTYAVVAVQVGAWSSLRRDVG